MAGYYGTYALVALLGVLGVGFVASGLLVNRLLRPRHPTGAKLTTYESGVDPVGEGWAQTQVRYFIYAFFYVVFAVEAVFIYPWAVVVARHGFGAATLVEMGVFVAFLAATLVYAWRRGVLAWV